MVVKLRMQVCTEQKRKSKSRKQSEKMAGLSIRIQNKMMHGYIRARANISAVSEMEERQVGKNQISL